MPRRKGRRRRLFAALALWGFAGGMLLLSWFLWDMPSLREVKPLDTRPSISILARDGSLIARYGNLKGDLVAIGQVPEHLRHAVIATEDRRFYSHIGIDFLGLARAMWANARAGSWVQGGSTITQQLAKNLFLTPDKTLRRKVQEALMALWIERRFEKDEILEAYLNRVYFGAGAYGVDAAARVYFGKPASAVTLWEGAVLAGLLKAPSRYSPAASPDRARDRAATVLQAMVEAGYLQQRKADAEKKAGRIRLGGTGLDGDLNRYFADWVADQIDDYVTGNENGIVVRTTLHPQLQRQAEEAFKGVFSGIGEKEHISQGALVTLSPDGGVLAMIGGVDYGKSQFNRAVQAQRQPGSSFKPFVYLAALEAGFGKDDMIEDAPFSRGKYRPQNYDGKYYGRVTLETALAFSLNAATVRLLDTVGVSRLLDVTRRLGFTAKFRPELSTGLGSGVASLIEMTNAYAVIANGGHTVWPYAILSIEDGKGKTLYRREDLYPMRAFSSGDIRALDQMMVQVVARGTGQAAQLSRGHVAGKTGTSQNYRDAWFIGYTGRMVTGIWMGNDDDSPMERISGGKYPARLWHDYMEATLSVDVPATAFGRIGYGSGPGQGAGGTSGGGFGALLDQWSAGDFDGNDKSIYNE